MIFAILPKVGKTGKITVQLKKHVTGEGNAHVDFSRQARFGIRDAGGRARLPIAAGSWLNRLRISV